ASKRSWTTAVSDSQPAQEAGPRITQTDNAVEGSTLGWIALALLAAGVLLTRAPRGAGRAGGLEPVRPRRRNLLDARVPATAGVHAVRRLVAGRLAAAHPAGSRPRWRR